MLRAPSSPTAPPESHGYTLVRQPSASRLRKQDHILSQAEALFARDGFEGTSLEAIGNASGFSRHNLLYYYPNKEALYQAVLDSVLDDWLGRMTDLSADGEPVQHDRTDAMLFSLPQLVADLAQHLTLETGDVILTGTPAGVGEIVHADVVECEVEGVGVLRNPVIRRD